MIQVKEILPSDDSCHLGLMIGGDTAMLRAWPVNPDGEPLLLMATIQCEPFRQFSGCDLIPKEGTLYLFSTYSETDYFLENVSYSGSESEFSAIINGYTRVMLQDSTIPIESPARSIPMRFLKLQDRSVSQDEYPVFSMVSSIVPKGIYLHPELQENYQFVLQFYSSDFPEPYEGIFYLTDSVGCLLLKKDRSGDGFFFVHSG